MLVYIVSYTILWGFPGGSEGKASACNVGDPVSIPGSGRSLGERNGNPLQYSYLENLMDRGAWQRAWSHREFGMTEPLNTAQNIFIIETLEIIEKKNKIISCCTTHR